MSRNILSDMPFKLGSTMAICGLPAVAVSHAIFGFGVVTDVCIVVMLLGLFLLLVALLWSIWTL